MLEPLFVPPDLPVAVTALTITDHEVCVAVTTTAPSASCPVCQLPATRIHSRYARSLLDLPVATRPVRLHLQARRFFCRTVGCPRWIFTERLPGLARPYAQRTTRLTHALRQIGLALGGEAGARLAHDLALPTSPASLLHLVRQLPPAADGEPARIIGIDDWAFRKGHTYGTIICNLESGAVLDLLPNREADTVATWLQAQPTVEIISRDRAGAYAEAATRGAPQARQVADRWHLLKNLGDALEELLIRLYAELSAALYAPTPGPAPQSTSPNEAPAELTLPPVPSSAVAAANTVPSGALRAAPPRSPASRAQQQSAARRAQRQARYEEVCRLRQLGWSLRRIADQLQLDRRTVRRWLRAGTFPEHQPRPRRGSQLDPYKPYLQERWHQGCQNARLLGDELRARGYRGGPTTVRDYVAGLRRATRHAADTGVAGAPAAAAPRLPRPRILKWLLWAPPEELTNAEYDVVAQICHHSREVTLAYGLVMDFQALVRERQGGQLGSWVAVAQASGVAEVASFARGLLRDWGAVQAGLEGEWSQGPVEGHVNRLKMLKRQMYGRAKFDLLRLRVLYAH